MKGESEIRALLRQREYIKLFLGNTVSRLGDSIDSIAFAWLVYKLTGSGLLMGTIWAVNALPNVILGPIAGVRVDRWHKKPVMLIADIGRGATVTLTAILLATGRISVWYLFVFTALNSTLKSFAAPARMSVLPRLVPKELMLSANGISRGTQSLAELAGLGLAGVIIGAWGIPVAFAVDAASFFFCATCVLLARIPALASETRISRVALPAFTGDFRAGLKVAFGNGLIRLCILLGLALNMLICPFNVLLPIYSDGTLAAGARGFSVLSASITLGMLIGSFVAGQVGRWLGRNRMLVASVFAISISLIGFVVARNLVGATAAALLLGVGCAVAITSVTTIVMTSCPPELLGRVSSVINSTAMAAMPAGTALAGIAVDIWSPVRIFLVLGIGLLAVPLLIASPLRRCSAEAPAATAAQAPAE